MAKDGEFGKGHGGSAWEPDTTHANDYPLGAPRPFYLPPKAMAARLRGSVDNAELHLARSRAGRIVRWAEEEALKKSAGKVKSFAEFSKGRRRDLEKKRWTGHVLKEGETVQGGSAWLVRYDKPVSDGFRRGERSWFRIEGLEKLPAGQEYRIDWTFSRLSGGPARSGVDRISLGQAAGAYTGHYSAQDMQESRVAVATFRETGDYELSAGVRVVSSSGQTLSYLTNVSSINRDKWLVQRIEVGGASRGQKQNGIVSTAANPAVAVGYPKTQEELHKNYLIGYRLGQPSPGATSRRWLVAWDKRPESTPRDYWGWRIVEAGRAHPAGCEVVLDASDKGSWGKLGSHWAYEIGEGQGGHVWFPALDKNWVAEKGENRLFVVCLEMDGPKLVNSHVFTQKVQSEAVAQKAADKRAERAYEIRAETDYQKVVKKLGEEMWSPQPLNAVYVDYEKMQLVNLPWFYARTPDGNIALYDLTPGEDKTRRKYEAQGKNLSEALAVFADKGWGGHDFYPKGQILVQLPGGGYQTIETHGETTFARFLSITGLVSMVLGATTMALAMTGVGAPLAIALLGVTAGTAGLLSTAGEIYQSAHSTEGISAEMLTTTAISLAASIVGLGSAGRMLAKSGRAVFQITKNAEKAKRGQLLLKRLWLAAKDAEAQGVQMGRDAMAQTLRMARAGKDVASWEQMARTAQAGLIFIDFTDTTISTIGAANQFAQEIETILHGPGTLQEKSRKIAEMLGRSFTNIGMMVLGAKDSLGDMRLTFGKQARAHGGSSAASAPAGAGRTSGVARTSEGRLAGEELGAGPGQTGVFYAPSSANDPSRPSALADRSWQEAWCATAEARLKGQGIVFTRREDGVRHVPYVEIVPIDPKVDPNAHRENHRAFNVRRTLNVAIGYYPTERVQADRTSALFAPAARVVSLSQRSPFDTRHEFEHAAGAQGKSSLYDAVITASKNGTIPTMAPGHGYAQTISLDEFVTHSGDLALHVAMLQKHAANLNRRRLSGEKINHGDNDVAMIITAQIQLAQITENLRNIAPAAKATFANLPTTVTERDCVMTTGSENGVKGVVVQLNSQGTRITISLWGEPYVGWLNQDSRDRLATEVSRRVEALKQSIEETILTAATIDAQVKDIVEKVAATEVAKPSRKTKALFKLTCSLSERANGLPSNPEKFDAAWFEKSFWQSHELENIAKESQKLAEELQAKNADQKLIGRALALSESARGVWTDRARLAQSPQELAPRLSAIGIEARTLARQAEAWVFESGMVPDASRDLEATANQLRATASGYRDAIKAGDREPTAGLVGNRSIHR